MMAKNGMVIERTSSITNQLWQNCAVYIEADPKNIAVIIVDFIRYPVLQMSVLTRSGACDIESLARAKTSTARPMQKSG
jgi:hypothetical protein